MPRTIAPFAIASTFGLLACSEAPTNPLDLLEDAFKGEPPINVPATAALAFVSTRDGSPHIYVANADGSGVTRVTEGSSPAWSRDGRRIAFVRHSISTGRGGIYVMNADGSDLRYVGPARTSGPGVGPAWSPDDRITFTVLTGWFTADLYVMTSDGSDATRLFSPGGFADWCPGWPCSTTEALLPLLGAAAWSPDGRSMAFRENASQHILILDADGSGIRELEELRHAGSVPAWSPDGSRIAVVSKAGVGEGSVVYSFDLTSCDLTVIEPRNGPPVIAAGDPDWSPDGTQLVFDLFDPTSAHASGPDWKRKRIFVMSLDSGEMRQLIPEAVNPTVAEYSDYAAVWSRVAR
jgi:Tol biopolymer transport system component